MRYTVSYPAMPFGIVQRKPNITKTFDKKRILVSMQ